VTGWFLIAVVKPAWACVTRQIVRLDELTEGRRSGLIWCEIRSVLHGVVLVSERRAFSFAGAIQKSGIRINSTED
jgi:hypothetical protein